MRTVGPALLGIVGCGAGGGGGVEREPVGDTGAPCVPVAVWTDADGDGWGSNLGQHAACGPGPGEVLRGGDCDDTDPSLHPETPWPVDADGDGYGHPTEVLQGCTPPEGAATVGGDCDDTDPAVHPDAQEVCDPDDTDEDCDGLAENADDSLALETNQAWYPDGDGDGWGTDADVWACERPAGHASEPGDCDDGDGFVHPGAEEVCGDGVDNDCSGDAVGCRLEGVMRAEDAGFRATSTASGEGAGWHPTLLDLDGDGAQDLVLAGPQWEDAAVDAGRVGWWAGPLTAATDLDSADRLWTGGDPHAQVGRSLASPGDLDGDGVDDLLVGQRGGADAPGGVALLYGGAPPASGPLASAADLTFTPPDGTRARYGLELRGVGDATGDGGLDLAISAPGVAVSSADEGVVWLFSGPELPGSGAVSTDAAVARVRGGAEGATLGALGSTAAGDQDGDGVSDLLLVTGSDAGQVVSLLYGPVTGPVDLLVDADATLPPTTAVADLTVVPLDPSAPADLDGDGYRELLLSSPTAGGYTGTLYVFAGASARWSGDGAAVSDAVWTVRSSTATDGTGATAAVADFDGDGRADLLVSSPGDDAALVDAGAVYGFYGPVSAGAFVADTDAHLTLRGAQHLGWLGAGRLSVGDLTGDGPVDLVAGAPGVAPSGGVRVVAGAGL